MSHEDDPTPIWKKELSFRRQEPDVPGAQSAWEEELALWGASSEPGPVPKPESSEHELPTAPAASGSQLDHSWLTQPLEEISDPAAIEVAGQVANQPETAPTESFAPVIPLPAPSVDPPVELPLGLPVVELPIELAADRPAAGETAPLLPLDLDPPLVEESEAEIEAPELASTAEPAAKVPFYKREISLKRTPREPKPKAEKKPRGERKPKLKAVKAEKPEKKEKKKPEKSERAETVKVPFYKRDLSLKRSSEWDPSEGPEPPKRQRPKLPKREPRGDSGAKKVVGLKIGASQIAAARIVNGGEPELLQAVRAPLDHGIVVGGELRDPEALAVALKDFFKEHKLPRRGIRLGIANNRIGVRTLEIVGIDDPKQLDNAIKFRAQEVLPIPIEDAVLDYQVLSESVDGDGQSSRRVLLVVAYRDLVDRYVNACRKAGLQIVGIDLEAFALLRALAEPRPVAASSDGGALVAVAVGHDRSTFAVSDGRICEFTRVLQWGGSSLNIAIARALDTAPSEAEPLKRALSFAGPEELPEGFTEDQLAAARDAARRQLQSFARELVSSLQFYQSQPGSLSIGEIVVTGGTAHLPGLGSELERLVGVPVRVGDPLGRVKVSKKVKDHTQIGSLAVAIGLGIED